MSFSQSETVVIDLKWDVSYIFWSLFRFTTLFKLDYEVCVRSLASLLFEVLDCIDALLLTEIKLTSNHVSSINLLLGNPKQGFWCNT